MARFPQSGADTIDELIEMQEQRRTRVFRASSIGGLNDGWGLDRMSQFHLKKPTINPPIQIQRVHLSKDMKEKRISYMLPCQENGYPLSTFPTVLVF
ncbi:hypothetical protein TNCV_4388231 [Trichonephila clavipes]|nr:hypothetical protein TNCV_4388231 [Trichonephila clavipes]